MCDAVVGPQQALIWIKEKELTGIEIREIEGEG
jgi:hypothetical protein